MKLSNVLILSAVGVSNAWVSNHKVGTPRTVLFMSNGVYYSTSTGNTETIAGYITAATGIEAEDIGDATNEEILAHDGLIVG